MLVLASASPRRRELLKKAGVEFVVRPANIQEEALAGESARNFAERMAREKARVVWNQEHDTESITKDTKFREAAPDQRDSYVLGADTVVVVDDVILGKPENAEDAGRMLRLLSGRQHEVITAVCLLGRNFEDVRSETTSVCFSAIPESEMRRYTASQEPMDKAGGYAIQGGASRWVRKIEGDYSNVVGLPVELVVRMMREHRVIKG
jgi:septum formation protein